ncbi:MAG: acyl-CoA-binding protein [Myxococcales bacterium]|nr:acyl-CoA-binding protein [Myxococcales bacterium]MCB9716771.1 acyl-CoA-binding protein [Myxococcales bacterium]
MDLDDDFNYAVERSRLLDKQPNNVLLDLYALYKQASAGDVSGSRPGMTKMRDRAKYDAWAGRKGMAQDEAKKAYIALVDSLE